LSGKVIRLKHLFGHSERLFAVPMDHGVTVGPVQGLIDICGVVSDIGDMIDAIIVHKGMVNQLEGCLNRKGCQLIVHLSASSALSPDPNRKELVTSVEHSIRMGATAVSVHVNLGSEFEAQMLKDLGNTAEQCELWGMPLLAMMYVRDGSEECEYHPGKIKHAARIAEELGADIIKVNYTGSVDSFYEVTNAVKIPVIIAGGPKMSSDNEVYSMVCDAVRAGARGVAIGRNIFQHDSPAQITCAIRKMLDREYMDDTTGSLPRQNL